MAVDQHDTLWVYSDDGQFVDSFFVDLSVAVSGMTSLPDLAGYCRALAFDPVVDQLRMFTHVRSPGIYNTSGQMLASLPDGVLGAEWDDTVGGFLVVLITGDFYRVVNYGPPVFVRSEPPEIMAFHRTFRFYGGTGLAFDPDTKVMWYTTNNAGFWGLDPLTLDPIAVVPLDYQTSYGGAAARSDQTPFQEPELLVSGRCPGTVFVTAVDATWTVPPGVVSGTTPGQRSIPGGACAGTTLDRLGDDVPLVALRGRGVPSASRRRTQRGSRSTK